LKSVKLIENSEPAYELQISDFKYDDEDKKIIDFFKQNKCIYDPSSKKWFLSKAYYDNFFSNIKNAPFSEFEIIKSVEHVKNEDIKKLFPAKFTPYDFQIDGINFLLKNKLAILGDGLGTGKTIQSLIALKKLYIDNKDLRTIIVVPLSLIESNWKPQFNAIFEKPIDDFPNFKIVNYEKFRTSEKDEIINNHYDVGIFDEASRLRNATQFRKGIERTKIDRIWLLSGEIIEKDPLDIFGIVNTFFDYFNYVDFNNKFVIRKILRFGDKRVEKIVGFKNLETLRDELKPIYLRRTKDSIDELKKVEIETQNRVVLLLKEQELKLREIAHESIVKEKMQGSNEFSYMLSLFQKTRLIIDDAEYENNDAQIVSSKYDELKNVLEEAGDEKVLVFTSYKIILEKLYKNLVKDGFEAIIISSDMPTEKRANLLAEFKSSKIKNILLTSDIFSSGQNINEASSVIHYDLPLIASNIIQRIGRINRLDQVRNSVYNIIIKTNSKFDKNVENILNKKLAYNSIIKGEIPSFSFNEEEIKEIMSDLV
jgi:superfamily II DNA or RNA helicase